MTEAEVKEISKIAYLGGFGMCIDLIEKGETLCYHKFDEWWADH